MFFHENLAKSQKPLCLHSFKEIPNNLSIFIDLMLCTSLQCPNGSWRGVATWASLCTHRPRSPPTWSSRELNIFPIMTHLTPSTDVATNQKIQSRGFEPAPLATMLVRDINNSQPVVIDRTIKGERKSFKTLAMGPEILYHCIAPSSGAYP